VGLKICSPWLQMSLCWNLGCDAADFSGIDLKISR
jgi:hypothetical protein